MLLLQQDKQRKRVRDLRIKTKLDSLNISLLELNKICFQHRHVFQKAYVVRVPVSQAYGDL